MNTWVKTKKLTKANSHMSGDTIFYVAKKLDNEKPSSLYWAYLYPSGFSVRGHNVKEELFKWLDNNIDRIEAKIKERGLS